MRGLRKRVIAPHRVASWLHSTLSATSASMS